MRPRAEVPLQRYAAWDARHGVIRTAWSSEALNPDTPLLQIWQAYDSRWTERENEIVWPHEINNWARQVSWKRGYYKCQAFLDYDPFENDYPQLNSHDIRLSPCLYLGIRAVTTADLTLLQRAGYGQLVSFVIAARKRTGEVFNSEFQTIIRERFGMNPGRSISNAWWSRKLANQGHGIQRALMAFLARWLLLLWTGAELFVDLCSPLEPRFDSRTERVRIPRPPPVLPIPPTAPLAPPVP